MKKINNILEKFIRIFFIILVLGIIVVNINTFSLDNSKMFFYSFLVLTTTVVVIWLYKRKFIKKELLYIYIFILFVIGLIIRIYFINTIKFNLMSDFEFVYKNAEYILNGTLAELGNINYLSYNGYSYIYSYLLMILFKIFSPSVNVILYTNVICQILTVYMLYKIIKIKTSKETALLSSVTYFLLPTIICANLLVSTETPFMLVFFTTIYLFYKIIDRKDLNLKNILLFILLGISMSVTNNIRPVMTVFIIALIIYYVLNLKNYKELLLLLISLVAYKSCEFGFNAFVENGIGRNTKSGALGWSVYFGANYEYCGAWSPEDSEYVFEVLEDETKGDKDLILLSLERYKDYGLTKSAKLMNCKYKSLWTNNVGTFNFVNDIINKENTTIDFLKLASPFSSISRIITLILCAGTILVIIYEIKTKKSTWFFLELFGLGYILSNFIVCLNGRYNLPLYPILIICATPLLEKLFIPKKVNKKTMEIEKIKSKPKTLLIIPAFNEEEVIENTIKTVTSKGYDYIIINDGSIDNTEKICIKNNYNYISLVSNLGIGGAVQTGYKYAQKNNYDIAIQFDADGQHDINHVETLIKPIIEGKAHFVIGSRFVKGSKSKFKSTKLRQVGIKMISWITKEYTDKRILDTTSGFRAANKEVIKRFASSYPLEYPEPISTFELLKDGYIVKEVPVEMYERAGGKSSIMSWKSAYYMFNVFFSIIIAQIRGEK